MQTIAVSCLYAIGCLWTQNIILLLRTTGTSNGDPSGKRLAGHPCPPLAGIQLVVDRLGPDRILYGSDGSVGHPSAISYALKIVDELHISDDVREKILGGNIARLLGIGSGGKKGRLSGCPPERGLRGLPRKLTKLSPDTHLDWRIRR